MTGALLAAGLAVMATWCAARATSERSTMRVLQRAGYGLEGLSAAGPHGRQPLRQRLRTARFSSRLGRALMGSAGLALGMVVGGPPLAVCGAAAGLAGPAVVARRSQARRLALVEAQLADVVGATAAALRSGLSLSQSIRFAGDEGDPPVSASMRRVAEREGLGVPLDDSLERWVRDERLPDVRLVASVLQLHHRVGGDSPAVLDQVARTLRLRRAAAHELRSLTAQARLSGAVLGLLPVGFFAFMSVISRHDVQAAYRSPAGMVSILAGLALDAGAFVWIRKLLTIPA